MANDVPDGWPGIVAAVLGVIGWFMTLERRLSNKLDRTHADAIAEKLKQETLDLREEAAEKRDIERQRIDIMFEKIFERMDERAKENMEFQHKINDALQEINLRLARHGFNGNGSHKS